MEGFLPRTLVVCVRSLGESEEKGRLLVSVTTETGPKSVTLLLASNAPTDDLDAGVRRRVSVRVAECRLPDEVVRTRTVGAVGRLSGGTPANAAARVGRR